MIGLKDGTLLYHASYTEIWKIDLTLCKKGLDFGQGFYTTSSFEQAVSYVPQAVRKYSFQKSPDAPAVALMDGRVNIYRFHSNPNLLVHYFLEADIDWLHFVSANRDNSLFPTLLRKLETADVIGGKIADDATRRVLIDYTNGAYGQPGTPRADRFALECLLPNRLQDQFCFRTPDGIRALEFVRSERYGNIIKSDRDIPGK